MTFDLVEWMPVLVTGAELTVLLTFTTFAFALLVGLVISLARFDRHKPYLFLPASAFVEIIRGTPMLVQLYYLFFVLPLFGIRLDPIPTAILGMGTNYGCYISEVFRGGIAAIDRGQWEASAALGLPRSFTLRHIILPQAVRIVVPPLGNYLVSLFKDTALVSTIGVSELLFSAKLLASINFHYLEIFTLVAGIYFALSFPAALFVRRLETWMRYDR